MTMRGYSRPGEQATNIGVVAAAAVLFLLVFVKLSAWSDDTFNNLGSAYRITDQQFIHGFANAARDLCPADAEDCRLAQSIVESNNTAVYPITALVSLTMWLDGLDQFARSAVRASTLAGTANLAVAIALFLFVVWRAPPTFKQGVVFFVLVGAFFRVFGVPKWSPVPAEVLYMPSYYNANSPMLALALVLALTGVGFWLLFRVPGLREWITELTDRIAGLFNNAAFASAVAIAIVIAFALIAISDPGFRFDRALLLLAFLGLFAVSALVKNIHWSDAAILAVMFILLAVPESLAFISKPAPKGQLALVAVPLLSYLFFRPDSRMAYLLPALILFHVSVAAVVCATVFGAEIVVSCVRRRTTRLLWWSLATAVAGFLVGAVGATGWGTVQGSGLTALIGYALDNPLFTLATLLGGSAFLAAGIWVMRHGETEYLAVARVILLIGIGFVLYRVFLLVGAYHPLGKLDPQFSVLYEISKYYVRTIYGPCLLTMIVAWLMLPVAGREGSGESWEGFGAKPATLAFTALLALCVAEGMAPEKIGGRVTLAWQNIWQPESVPLPNPRVDQLLFDDEIYLLQKPDPKKNDLTFLSLLKLRMRVASGRFDPDEARIQVLE